MIIVEHEFFGEYGKIVYIYLENFNSIVSVVVLMFFSYFS
jgi:hypothetical protein